MIMRPDYLFNLLARYTTDHTPQGTLSIIFSLAGGIYIWRLSVLFRKLNISTFPFWIFCPYLYYFSIFPSSDFLGAIFVLEIIILSVAIYGQLGKGNLNRVHFISLCLFCALAALCRSGFSSFLILPIFIIFLLYLCGVKVRMLEFVLAFFLTFIFAYALYYYWGKLVTYKATSFQYQQALIFVDFSSSYVGKFFASFGLRESYMTTAGPGFTKNPVYVYLRLVLSAILIVGFIRCCVYVLYKKYGFLIILLIYSILYITAIVGVSFERYFLSVHSIFFQLGAISIIKYVSFFRDMFVNRFFK